MNVLVINAGSSSLKYQLLNPATGDLLAKKAYGEDPLKKSSMPQACWPKRG